MCKYSVVVPVYNSERSLEELYERVRAVFDDVIQSEAVKSITNVPDKIEDIVM